MSAWKDFVTAALLGTEKSSLPTPLPATLENLLGPAETLEPEARFLTQAGALALWRRVGRKPVRAEGTTGTAAPPDRQPLVNPTSVAHLRVMLGGHHAETLPEWLGEVARLSKRVPPEELPTLLEWARQNRARRPLVVSAGGERVRWLAMRNPAWNFAADDSPERWETGGREQRVAVLRGWRAAQPAEARARLEAVWNAEAADTRAAFLAVLAGGISMEDEPLLERALDDRSKTVQAEAAGLLARLPTSTFVARMTARAAALLTFNRGGLLGRASLTVHLPDPPDEAGRRDGLDPKLADTHRVFGEKAGLVVQILTAVPLAHWTQTFAQAPAALLKAVEKDDFARAVVTGWTQAALAQRNAAWAEALLDVSADLQAPPNLVRLGALCGLLPAEARTARLSALVRRHGLGHGESWRQIEAMIGSFPAHLPVPFAQELLREMHILATVEIPWHLRAAMKNLATKIPPKLLPLALDHWPENNPAADFVALLAFRRDALAALAQS